MEIVSTVIWTTCEQGHWHPHKPLPGWLLSQHSPAFTFLMIQHNPDMPQPLTIVAEQEDA